MSLIDSRSAAAGETNTTTLQTVEICRYTLQENGSVSILAHATCRKDSNNVAGAFLRHCSASRGTGGAVINAQGAFSTQVPLGFVAASVTFEEDGNDVVLVAHGALLTNLHWAGSMDVIGEFET